MYPHFQLIMDKFKTQEDEQQINLSDIPILGGPEDPTYSQQEIDQEEYLTGDQRVERAMASENPQASDEIIRNMMRNNDPEDIEYPQDLRGIKKPKSLNKKKGEKDKTISTPGYQAPIQISPNAVEIDPDMQDQAENQYLAPVRIDLEMEVNISQDQSEMENTDDLDY